MRFGYALVFILMFLLLHSHRLSCAETFVSIPVEGLESYSEESISEKTSRYIGSDAVYYVGVHFRQSDMPEKALELFEEAAENASSPIRMAARESHLSLLFERGRYEEAVRYGKKYLEKREMRAAQTPIRGYFYAGLLALERYEELAAELSGDEDSAELAEWGDGKSAARRDFFRVWERWHRREQGWQRGLLEYMSEYPVGLLPDSLYAWLGFDIGGSSYPDSIRGLDYEELDSGQSAFIRAKMLLAEGRYRDAFYAYRSYLSTVGNTDGGGKSMAGLFTSHPGDEYVRAVLYSGHLWEGMKLAEAARERLEEAAANAASKTIADAEENLFWFLETEAYLKRRLGRYPETMRLYERACELAPEDQRERMRWYRYDSLMRIDPEGAVEELLRLTDEWEEPAYYDDVLFDLADRLVRSRRWELIARSADILVRTSRSFSAARFSYIAARAAELGYFEAEEPHIRMWFAHAVKSGCGAGAANYYRIMAEERLEVLGLDGSAGDGGWWPFCRQEGRSFTAESTAPASADPAALRVPAAADTAKILSGYIAYDLPEYAFELYGDNEELLSKLSPFTVRRWAGSLQRQEAYLESVRLLSRYLAAAGRSIELEDVHLLYPRAYESIMEEVSDEFGLPDYLLFALVREESLFSADISSTAGAVGLSQLMPSTARDVASRIGMEVTDLTDPELNLRLGGWYLDHLIGRTDSYSQALFSYNGGITRVRRWVRGNPELPGDLLLEAIPFKETSHYGRKVLVSAVVYGYIYHGIEIREIVESFFEI